MIRKGIVSGEITISNGRREGSRRAAIVQRAIVFGIGLSAVCAAFYWYRTWPLRELPEMDLSQADPAVAAAVQNARIAVLAAPRSSAAWGDLGQCLEAHDFHAEALVCLRQASQLDPIEFRWPYLCGEILNSRDRSAAERCFREAARLRPRMALPRVRLGELFLELRRLEQAAPEFEAACRIDPQNARALFGLGQVAVCRGDFAQARRWAEQSFARDPEHRQTAELLLRIAYRLDDKPGIVRQQAVLDAMPRRDVIWDDPFVENIELKRRDMNGLAATATDLIENGRLPEAVSTLERLVASNPENPQWYSLLCLTLIKQRNFALALQVLETGLERHPRSAELHFHRGVVYFSQEKWEQAAGEFRKATELKPDFRDARYNLGHALVKQGDRAAAIVAFREAVRLRPDDVPSYINLSKLLRDTGDYQAARNALETATRIAPANDEARRLLERLPAVPPAAEASN